MPELNAEQRERLDRGLEETGCSGFLDDHPQLYAAAADLITDAQREAAQAVLDAVEAAYEVRDRAFVVLDATRDAARAAAARYGAGTAVGGDGR